MIESKWPGLKTYFSVIIGRELFSFLRKTVGLISIELFSLFYTFMSDNYLEL